MKEKKLRIEDALNATRAAVEEGIVAGGGSAYVMASKACLLYTSELWQIYSALRRHVDGGGKLSPAALSGELTAEEASLFTSLIQSCLLYTSRCV